jgi:hypothetical protein
MRATARAGFVFTASEIRMLAGHFSPEDGRGSVGYRKVQELNCKTVFVLLLLLLAVQYFNSLSHRCLLPLPLCLRGP